MARRLDTGWRDGLLTVRHAHWGHEAPAAGMKFPMVEYDRGEPLAVISYQRRGEPLPHGKEAVAAHNAFGNLFRETGEQLPFLTVQYDTRNWSYRAFAHNEPAQQFLGDGWTKMTETEYVRNLYRLRGRHAPGLAPYGVDFQTSRWDSLDDPEPGQQVAEDWPHQLMSTRRRNFEPIGQTRMRWRNPCLDIDLAVVGRDQELALVVDYKAPSARINLASTNLKALSALCPRNGVRNSYPVAAMLVSYVPGMPEWTMRVYCLNKSSRAHLSYVLGGEMATEPLNAVIVGTTWVDLTERQWQNVLNAARDL